MGGVTSKRKDRITQEDEHENDENRRRKYVFLESPSIGSRSKGRCADTGCESRMEDTIISENEKKELVSLFTDKNMPMDFILEMKEAFLYFDKVTYTPKA